MFTIFFVYNMYRIHLLLDNYNTMSVRHLGTCPNVSPTLHFHFSNRLQYVGTYCIGEIRQSLCTSDRSSTDVDKGPDHNLDL